MLLNSSSLERFLQSVGLRYVTGYFGPGGLDMAADIDRTSTAGAIFRQALTVREACAP